MRRTLLGLALPLLLAISALSCSGDGDRTEIIVAVDTDLLVPEELDGVRIDMVGPSGELRRTMGPLSGLASLPATVGMVHRTGPLGPVQITVVGSLAGRDIIQRRASVSFVAGRTLVLYVPLVAECLDLRCPPNQTCAPGGCRDIAVDPSELVEWDESVDRIFDGGGGDASMDAPDGDACVPVAEVCNGEDDDCDGDADEEFDTETDILNCGTCGNACPESPPNAASACSAGVCTLACDPGFDDCDLDAMTGCEALLSAGETCGDCTTICEAPTPLCEGDVPSGFACVDTCSGGLVECGTACADLQTDALNCGACDNACVAGAHAAASCTAGGCGMACDPGWDDCDGAMDTGCETDLTDVASCGACGSVCELPGGLESCASGTCELVGCEGSLGDCDSDEMSGCETDLATSTMDCGTCGTVCPDAPANSATVCEMGACGFQCDPGFGDCDGDAGNGCETILSDAATCGSCGISCADPTPICSGSAGAGFTCVGTCAAPDMLCGTVCTDTDTDPLNCGACDTTCAAAPQASAACVGAACALSCDPGFGDCNAMTSDGCETDVTTSTDCGSCGTACAPTNATGMCSGGACTIASCDAGWLDCDMDASNGCETSRSDPMNCGACGNVCPTGGPGVVSSSCTLGTCTLTCAAGLGNCNGDLTDGCEMALTSLSDCGACGVPCVLTNATATCASGTCQVASCNADFGDCDGAATNGCETDLNTRRFHCSMCGNDCGAGVSCCSGVCARPPCP